MAACGAGNAVTVVRLPNPGDRRCPLELVQTTIARVDLAVADALHAGDAIRPYACVRRRDTVDVVAFDDAIAGALLRGAEAARLVTRTRWDSLLASDRGERVLRLAFETPTHFRVAGREYQLPDPFHVFGSLVERWRALGWPEMAYPDLKRLPVWPEQLRFRTHPTAGGLPQRGVAGVVRFDLLPLADDDRATLWTLARFAEYRGVGKHTTYGMGRVRVLRDGEPWTLDACLSVWDAEARRQRAA